MNARNDLLHGLIDYAGLYPPAALDMHTAVRNYLDYCAGPRASALGRYIVDLVRLKELRADAADRLQSMRLSVIVAPGADFRALGRVAAELPIESVEIKCDEPLTITGICYQLPEHVERYFEVSLASTCTSSIDALASVDARAKIRMGGIVVEAFPSSEDVVRTLHTLADRRVPFKATAGLHHPIRSLHPLTYAADAPRGTMHGFVNFFCAAAAIYFGESTMIAQTILEEQDSHAFHFAADAIGWRSFRWSADQVNTIRQEFFISYGSCSFTEPMQDLEALGWL